MNTDDLALGYVLDALEPGDRARAEAALSEDPSFAEAVDRARADVGDIARGIELMAADASRTAHARAGTTRRLSRLMSAAAVVAVLAAGVAVFTTRQGDDPPVTETTPPTSAGGVPGACELGTLTGDLAVAIVTGTVTKVASGSGEDAGGIEYQIATVAVEETIRGVPGSTVHAFDYTYGAPWVQEGERVLLFLASSTDTVHETVDPSHLQVLSGDCGSVAIEGDRLVGVEYTLDDVRAR